MFTSQKILALATALLMTLVFCMAAYADDSALEDDTDGLRIKEGTHLGYDYTFSTVGSTHTKIKSSCLYGTSAAIRLYNQFSFVYYNTEGQLCNYNFSHQYITSSVLYNTTYLMKEFTVAEAASINAITDLPSGSLFKYANHKLYINSVEITNIYVSFHTV